MNALYIMCKSPEASYFPCITDTFIPIPCELDAIQWKMQLRYAENTESIILLRCLYCEILNRHIYVAIRICGENALF